MSAWVCGAIFLVLVHSNPFFIQISYLPSWSRIWSKKKMRRNCTERQDRCITEGEGGEEKWGERKWKRERRKAGRAKEGCGEGVWRTGGRQNKPVEQVCSRKNGREMKRVRVWMGVGKYLKYSLRFPWTLKEYMQFFKHCMSVWSWPVVTWLQSAPVPSLLLFFRFTAAPGQFPSSNIQRYTRRRWGAVHKKKGDLRRANVGVGFEKGKVRGWPGLDSTDSTL